MSKVKTHSVIEKEKEDRRKLVEANTNLIKKLRETGHTVTIEHSRFVSNPLNKREHWEINELRKGIRKDSKATELLGLYNVFPAFINRRSKMGEIHPFGGETHVSIKKGEQIIAKGVAKCSLKDTFCRQTGISKALARAYNNIVWTNAS